MSGLTVVLKFLLPQTTTLVRNNSKNRESLTHLRSNLWAVEQGYVEVISAAPVNILSLAVSSFNTALHSMELSSDANVPS